jgi:hypothetical protein
MRRGDYGYKEFVKGKILDWLKRKQEQSGNTENFEVVDILGPNGMPVLKVQRPRSSSR